MANALIVILVKPSFISVHDVPLSVDKNTPPAVPVKIYSPLITIELMK